MAIKEKQTKRQKLYKKKQNKTNKTIQQQPKKKEKKNESAEAWTRTAFLPGNLLVYWATEENTMDNVKNIIFKAYFCGTLPVNAVESWSSGTY